MSAQAVAFYVGGAGLLASALGVVVARSPLRGALSLIVALCFLAALYAVLDASFVAAMQILVYAGAVMVLFVFVIMLLDLGPDANVRRAYLSVSKILGGVAAAYFVVRVVQGVVLWTAAGGTAGRPVDGSVAAIGRLLLTDHLFGFEAISVVLLVSVVGAVVLGLKRLT